MKNYNITQIHLLDINDTLLPGPGDQPIETLVYRPGLTDDHKQGKLAQFKIQLNVYEFLTS